MTRRALRTACFTTLCAGVLACGGGEDSAADDPDRQIDTAANLADTVDTEAAPAVSPQGPRPDAEAVWVHITDSDYTSWNTWPGKPERYPASAPHGALLTTYLNGPAYNALTGGRTSMPAGAIIVKENFNADGTHVATTIMYKVPGIDPGNGNWWYLKRLTDGTVEAEGVTGAAAQMCIACHQGRADNDYIMTGSLGAGGS